MQILVTTRAEQHFDSIVEHIKEKWGNKTANQFIQKTDELFKLLASYPAMGQIEQSDIRGFQLSKQVRVLYRIKEQQIIILAFFDTRQDPKKKFQ